MLAEADGSCSSKCLEGTMLAAHALGYASSFLLVGVPHLLALGLLQAEAAGVDLAFSLRVDLYQVIALHDFHIPASFRCFGKALMKQESTEITLVSKAVSSSWTSMAWGL